MANFKCTICKWRKPKCKKGKEIYNKMTARLLNRGLDMDETHMKLWRKWLNHKT